MARLSATVAAAATDPSSRLLSSVHHKTVATSSSAAAVAAASAASNAASNAAVVQNSHHHHSYDVLLSDRVRNYPPLSGEGLGHSIDHSPTLVLNSDFQPLSHLPLSLWRWQDSLRAVFAGKAIVVSEYADLWVRSVSCAFKLPSVIALTKYQKHINKAPVMSRRNVYLRDGFRCCYCSTQLPVAELSMDHVVPRSKGGKLTWTNTVSACFSCNTKKGHLLPDEIHRVGLRLRSLPRVPTAQELQLKSKIFKKRTIVHPHWSIYLGTE
jgi:hypothetical protein